uniref:AraC effector-binding domain-containing protein n=1 Tax=Phytophthora ramorum TaxID=164328 RepID=H3GFC5_PHYRM
MHTTHRTRSILPTVARPVVVEQPALDEAASEVQYRHLGSKSPPSRSTRDSLSYRSKTPTVKSLPRVRVLSLRSVIPNYRAQGELWKQLFECATTHNVAIAGPTFAVNFTLDCRQSDVEVEVCLPIGDDAEVSVEAPFSTRDVPAVPRAAVMVYVGPCEGYFSAYQEFFGWIASEKLTSAGPSREVYVKRPSGNSEEDADSVTEIQLPIGEQASS